MNNTERKIKEAIGEIFKNHPDISNKEFLSGFADFIAYLSTQEKNIMPFFTEEFLKWFVYYSQIAIHGKFKNINGKPR